MRNVFGDSDDEEAEEYATRNDIDHDSNVSIQFLKAICLIYSYQYLLSDICRVMVHNDLNQFLCFRDYLWKKKKKKEAMRKVQDQRI